MTIPVEAEAAGAVNEQRRGRRLRELAQVLAAGWIVRATFILLVPSRAHSIDVDSWITVAQQLRAGANPYATTPFLNWPPLWMCVVWLLDHTARGIGLSFFLTLRLFLIAVESVLIVTLYSFLRKVAPADARRIVLAGISLNPIAILLVCQQGNFDVLVGLCALVGALALSSYACSRDAIVWLAGSLAFGLGALAKTVPLVLAPLLAQGAAASRPLARVIASALFVGPMFLGIAVILVLAPGAVIDYVVLYRSAPGNYGITGLADAVGARAATAEYARVVFPAILALWLALGCFRLWRHALDERRTLLLAAIILFAVPTLGPGYAPQYAYWWLPLLVATYPLFDRKWRYVLVAFYVLAAATYIVEYGLLAPYGAFLDAFFPGSSFLRETAIDFRSPAWQSVLQAPLFAASIIVLSAGVRRLRPTNAKSTGGG